MSLTVAIVVAMLFATRLSVHKGCFAKQNRMRSCVNI
jgi:hypothetical protein